MNLVRIGKRTLNLDLVSHFDESDAATHEESESDSGDSTEPITAILSSGANLRFTGLEAQALRRFLAENCRDLPIRSPFGEFSAECIPEDRPAEPRVLPPESQGRQERGV